MEEKHSDLLERKEGLGVVENDLEERSVIQVLLKSLSQSKLKSKS